MGGSGGYILPNRDTDSDSIRKKIEESQNEERKEEFNRSVESVLNTLLTKFNSRDIEAIEKHIEEIKKGLNKEIDGTLDINYGGSVSKSTYVEGLSDIDSLVLLNDTSLEKQSPQAVRDYLFEKLKERLHTSDIKKGNLAVTISYSNYEIQLLPAVKTETGYIISSASGKEWSTINPQLFTKKMTEVNKANNNKVVPVIKLAKAIMSNLPENKRLSGYHAEALATDIFSDYRGGYKKSEMLTHFFDKAASLVKSPIKDTTKQSFYVDEYLGKEGSLERRKISDTLSRVSRKMKNAATTSNVRTWTDFFED